MTAPEAFASVRYIVDDVQAAIDFYTTYLGFSLRASAAPAFAEVAHSRLRLLLSGPVSSGARATPADATTGGRNRIHLIADDLDAEIDRLAAAGLTFRSDVVTGPGGRQILLTDLGLGLHRRTDPDLDRVPGRCRRTPRRYDHRSAR